jgi:hypothetical protein
MGTPVRIALGAIARFVVGAFLGYGGGGLPSGHVHDRGLEAIMTALFAAGPAGAVVDAAVGGIRARRRGRGTG